MTEAQVELWQKLSQNDIKPVHTPLGTVQSSGCHAEGGIGGRRKKKKNK